MEVFTGRVRDDYELEIRDERSGNAIRPVFKLLVTILDDSLDLRTIEQAVPKNMRVSPTRTLADGIDAGTYGSFTCALPAEQKFLGRRQTRILRVMN